MPRTLRLVLPLLVLLLLAACAAPPRPLEEDRGEGGSATASPTPLPPTATPQPTPTSTPTATPTPTPLPLAVRLTNTLLAAYADGHAEASQAPDGGWQVRFTAPTGQTVELKDVSAENLTMPEQDWVENYNGGKILLEGRAEDGTLWRVVEKNGERMLMYDQEITYPVEWVRYFWYAYDPNTGDFGAKFEAPGNGRVEMIKVHKEGGQWLDEEGNPFALSQFGKKYADHFHITEVNVPVITLDNWQVQALEAKDGHEYVIRGGKLFVDGKEVVVPEIAGGPKPESLMYKADKSEWYVGDWGLAFWRVSNGKVLKYDRPVVYGVDLDEMRTGPYHHEDFRDAANRLERIGQEAKVYQAPVLQWNGKPVPYGTVMIMKVPKWEKTIDVVVNGFLMEGYKVLPPNDNKWGFVIWVPLPFGDEVVDIWEMNPDFEKVAASGEIGEQDNALMGMDGFVDYVNRHRPLPVAYVFGGMDGKMDDRYPAWQDGHGGGGWTAQHWFILDVGQ